jgi:hypothetical protein
MNRRRYVGMALFAGSAMSHGLPAKILDPAPETAAALPSPLKAAYDGLEVVF